MGRGAATPGHGIRPGEAVGRALLAAMRDRGLGVADVARELPPGMDRATLHRLLAGETGDARLGTLLGACRAIGASPAEVLHRAGLDPRPRRGEGQLDEGLRRAFTRVRALPMSLRRIAVAQMGGLVEATEGLAREGQDGGR